MINPPELPMNDKAGNVLAHPGSSHQTTKRKTSDACTHQKVSLIKQIEVGSFLILFRKSIKRP